MTEQFFQFIVNHWALSAALVLIIVLLLLEEAKNRVSGNKISLQDATTLINRQRGVWIDVRDADAFRQGHIVNALNFPPVVGTGISLDKLKKYQEKPLILIGQSDSQVSRTADYLRKQGFQQAYCLAGGLSTWVGAGLPLQKN